MEIEHAGNEVFEAFESLASDRGGFVTADDLEKVGQALEPNSSAALLVWEDRWATRFAEAVRGAGGILVDRQTVPHELVQAAVDWNEENKAAIEAEEAAAAATA